ncbi:mannonate dehydratase [Mesorhizobium sp. LHD-90]|uniref:mannonate dehydratase n=1 Tax=Mesorhizobium sp. LHD-90 TaxID=3071414 RepID=UPI0027E1AB13|nr:mannonate dehydratase [Mesorhizobium sp. LHD-90]MDQ6438192.1 mannonate dehydratase [Mesorhizobium sp. LHD-90]
MRQTWRWFGPKDLCSVDDMRQAGVEGVVSALHHVQPGEVWTPSEIDRRQREIATMSDGSASTLKWEVVESLPVSEHVKKQKGAWRSHIEAWKASMRNLHDAGIRVICYNFMPVLDWTRTDLRYRVPTGATCMRFDIMDFAIFDIHILGRPNAAADFSEAVVDAAARRASIMADDRKVGLMRNIISGLPGGAATLSLDDVRAHLAEYDGISAESLRRNLIDFLEEVSPLAQTLGMRLCCHPDDPPFPLLGLPRIVSTEADYEAVMQAVDIPANGITLCSGSLGARPDNDLPGMMNRLGHRVHFLHLRNVRRESSAVIGSFHEDEHLAGETDMVALIAAVVREEVRRRAAGREDTSIPFRPDHGQDILDDHGRRTQPGYPTIGRLKGLAELRGIMKALEHPKEGVSNVERI